MKPVALRKPPIPRLPPEAPMSVGSPVWKAKPIPSAPPLACVLSPRLTAPVSLKLWFILILLFRLKLPPLEVSSGVRVTIPLSLS